MMDAVSPVNREFTPDGDDEEIGVYLETLILQIDHVLNSNLCSLSSSILVISGKMKKDGIKECYFGGGEADDGYDAIVVGSGYGGSVAACRLSMAGIKCCLLEKGRKWEAQDFPTHTLRMLSSVRFENKSSGFGLGPNDALFQIHTEHDSLAATACGLGGGSLVNAGVMLPTPVRARRNPKWPREWESDWKACEASASSMLNIQSVPVKFSNAKIMEKLVGDEFNETSSLKLSINFDVEEQAAHLKKPKEVGSCMACGNCLAGCPYNAKNSTDKNYLFSAVEAGCTIKTDCQVQYVVKNPNNTNIHRKRARRWLVFLNETDYLTSDFVILSGGVFGTADILFRSQTRGLKLSGSLGEGFSCNGNNAAYLAGCTTPLGVSTYGWPTGFWFLHGLIDKLKHSFGIKSTQAMVLNAMGYDESDGKITFEKNIDKISFSPPNDPLLPCKINAFQKLTNKLGGILFMSRYRSTSVHLLGGCNAASDHFVGVCNSNGQVFDTKSPSSIHSGLYVCDASLIPCSIGVNPCLTVATASEHVSRGLVQDINSYMGLEGKCSIDEKDDKKPGSIGSWKLEGRSRCDVRFKEVMRGHIGGMPCVAHLKLKMNTKTSKDFDQKSLIVGKSHPLLRGIVGGYLEFNAVERDRLHIIDGEVDLCEVDIRTPYAQFMHYHLLLTASSGSRYILEGKKVMNPFLLGLYGWKESTTLQVTFKKVKKNSPSEEMVDLKGELHISTIALLGSLISMEGNNRMKFVWLLLQSLFRTYILQKPRGNYMGFAPPELLNRQWKIKKADSWRFEGEKSPYPVLLINGYSTESYRLPTEPTDLVRTLLDKGHETWLLQPSILPILETTKANPNQKLLKSIARFMPRYERCTCDECEVFSGIFGNTFWHNNITSTLHHWMNKKSLPRLPMAAFPHLRKICNEGFIVDSKGNSSYLIHPERMALPTLYISGGRTLLVTPKTSFLANKYMKLHHPSFRHERVVVEGFGHSDLLIGGESSKKVFPHILSHMGLAEKEENLEENGKEKKGFNGEDGFEDGKWVIGGWMSPSFTVWFLLFLLALGVMMKTNRP
ncbi:4Fe-4S ferredoxin, iron-sulfur binding, conserved site-containing protein [Cynara cardunculus var. scolymus]|uniref:Cholesterol oxidase n=1 Tax=Cynara cardunculus var. scolymus TaxID=59895 RepID=A0A124SCQ7_CYNCS|nr:4Fe-4S ferredoxin, iron-sulfur binding, conserved site-containing protein [Cynara cardunculus var. scolymus]